MSRYPKILLNNEYDRIIIVTNSTLFLVLKNKRVSEKYKNKIIYYLHNEVKFLFGCKREISSVKSLIGISSFVVRSFREKLPSIKNKQCYVLKNGVDTVRFAARNELAIEEYRTKFGLGEKDFVVLFAGRLIPEKGALETIKAVKECKDADIKLLIVGSSFYSSDIIDNYTLQLREEAFPIKDRVVFTGYIDYDDMSSVYQLANVAVLPSVWEEPAGMTMTEALISGLPLITTKSGGIPEYVPEQLAVLLNREEDLVENIKKTLLSFKASKANLPVDPEVYNHLVGELSLENYYRHFAEILKKDCD